MKIKINEFWIVENGSIFQVEEFPTKTNSCYVGRRLSSNGSFIEKVGVDGNNFKEKITIELAKKKAREIMNEKIEKFFS